jgi:hypothetical protein
LRQKKTGKPKGHGYGKNKCPCVGIDNLRGYFAKTLNFYQTQYPLELGASCASWELNVHPECRGGAMPDWCKQDWCYVDPCNCDLDVPPKRSAIGITYQGIPAYYSYDTCAGFDLWSAEKNPDACVFQKDAGTCGSKPLCAWNGKQCLGKEAVQSCSQSKSLPGKYGDQDCRCVAFGGKTNGQAVRYIDENTDVPYDPNVGSECKPWEMEAHPDCKKDGAKPAWCSESWCYVDPCKCNIAVPPKAVMSVATYERFQGKTAYWSYATCGSVDHWSGKMKKEYCYTYATQASCEGMKKCVWASGKCMPTALGKICAQQKETGILGIEDWQAEDSGANSFQSFAGVLMVLGLLNAV